MVLAGVLRTTHVVGAWIVIVANGLVGLWALAAHRWEQYRDTRIWIATAVAELLAVPQIVLGVILIQGKDKSLYDFHMLYGFSIIGAGAILYSYRPQLEGKEYLLYGCGGLFIMGLGLRALAVGPS